MAISLSQKEMFNYITSNTTRTPALGTETAYEAIAAGNQSKQSSCRQFHQSITAEHHRKSCHGFQDNLSQARRSLASPRRTRPLDPKSLCVHQSCPRKPFFTLKQLPVLLTNHPRTENKMKPTH